MEDTESDRDTPHINRNADQNLGEEPHFAYLGDCLVLFETAWEDRGWPQSVKGLAKETGITRSTLSGYIHEHRRHRGKEPPSDCKLCTASRTFRYDIAVHPDGQRRIIDAIPRRYGQIPFEYESREDSVGATMTYSYSWAVEDVSSLPRPPCGRCAVPDLMCTFRRWFEEHRPGRCVVWCPFYLARGIR